MPGVPKIINWLFAAGIVICLLQIWLPGCYLTGDGPSHVYNATILHDLWNGRHETFYERYYDRVAEANPNWFSHIVLAGLMYVVNGMRAEQLLLSVYVLAFCGGFYLLLRRIGGASWWMLSVFLFVFPHVLTKGFYNFSFSLAFFLWVVWAWLRFMERRSIARGCVVAILFGLLFFSHLLGFAFGGMTCGALAITYSVNASNSRKQLVQTAVADLMVLLLMCAPFILLAFHFSQKQGGLQLSPKLQLYRGIELAEFKHLINFSNREVLCLRIAGIVFAVTVCCAVMKKAFLKLHRYDGFIIAGMVALLIYLFSPEYVFGGMVDMSTRTQLFVILLLACIVQYRVPVSAQKVAAGVMGCCFLVLSIMRVDMQLKCAEAVADYMGAVQQITPNSVVLPLAFSLDGLDKNGGVITDRNHSFRHVGQYLGTKKPLVLLDNYEAKTGYFPLLWAANTDPYTYLSKAEGLEAVPPNAEIANYTRQTGVQIDYVLCWCYKPEYLSDSGFSKLHGEVLAMYTPVYTSPTGRTILYKRK